MSDLVNRDDIIEVFNILEDKCDSPQFWEQAKSIIKDIRGYRPPDLVPVNAVKYAYWVVCDEGWMCCSNCNVVWEKEIIENCNMSYCPCCGAKMNKVIE